MSWQKREGSRRTSATRLCHNRNQGIYCSFVIPGLIRNPVRFPVITFLNAGRGSRLQRGSSPALHVGIRRYSQLRHNLKGGGLNVRPYVERTKARSALIVAFVIRLVGFRLAPQPSTDSALARRYQRRIQDGIKLI